MFFTSKCYAEPSLTYIAISAGTENPVYTGIPNSRRSLTEPISYTFLGGGWNHSNIPLKPNLLGSKLVKLCLLTMLWQSLQSFMDFLVKKLLFKITTPHFKKTFYANFTCRWVWSWCFVAVFMGILLMISLWTALGVTVLNLKVWLVISIRRNHYMQY